MSAQQGQGGAVRRSRRGILPLVRARPRLGSLTKPFDAAFKVPRQLGVLPDYDRRRRCVGIDRADATKPRVAAEKPSQKVLCSAPMGDPERNEVLMPSFWTDDPQLAGVKDAEKLNPCSTSTSGCGKGWTGSIRYSTVSSVAPRPSP
jgi:hypothetical protein